MKQTASPLILVAPGELHEACSKLLHVTSREAAFAILQTGTIFGTDAYGHANFSLKKDRLDLLPADVRPEIRLRFSCAGPHYLAWQQIAGMPPPYGLPVGGVLHGFTSNMPLMLNPGTFWQTEKYWQSIVYVGWATPIFVSLDWLVDPPKRIEVSRWARFCYWLKNSKTQRRWDAERLSFALELDELARAKRDTPITVVPHP